MAEEGRRDSVQSVVTQKGESRGSSRRRRLFWKLRQRWKLLGLFEIDKEHEFYALTCDLKEGLKDAIQDVIQSDIQPELTDEDYSAKLTQGHKGYMMRTYAGPVFRYFRQSLGMSEEGYQRSLSACSHYLQFISNSKSKADFFLTNDKRFFLKTQSKREVHFMLQILQKYMQHFQAYPHSLLVKILGSIHRTDATLYRSKSTGRLGVHVPCSAPSPPPRPQPTSSCQALGSFLQCPRSPAKRSVHSITREQEKKKYFIIMQSVFFPDERIIGRYDIKGCHISRWTEPEPEGSRVLQVFKDLNFEGNVICLDQQRSWLLRQTELDSRFLRELNVLDYSLLLGFQPLHADEKSQNWSLANLIVRTKRSVNGTGSPTTSHCASVPGTVEEEGDSVDKEDSSTEYNGTPEVTSARRLPLKKIGQQVSTVSDISDVVAQNRRLLPNYRNPLHVMDGPEQRYFIGIIDIFTVYGWRKKLEHLWKSMRYRGQEFSTISPNRYSQRLCRWVETHTV